MKFVCDQCKAQYQIADEKVGPRGVKVKCKKCGHIIVVKAPLQDEATTVDPGAAERMRQEEAGNTSASEITAPGAKVPAPAAPVALGADVSGAFNAITSHSRAPEAGAMAGSGEKLWHVTVGEAQVGPIDAIEVQQRLQRQELSEDSLAWKNGMPDWVPLSEIPAFAHLMQQKGKRDRADGGAVAAAGRASAAAAEWKPSAASALSSLVQDELLAKPKEAPAPAKSPEGAPDLNLPNFAAGDVFAGRVGGPVAPSGGNAEMAGPGAAWSVPTGASRTGNSNRGLFIGIGLLAVILVGGFVAVIMTRSAEAPAPPPPPPVAAAPVPAVAPAKPASGEAGDEKPAAEKSAAEGETEHRGRGAGKAKHAAGRGSGSGSGSGSGGAAAAAPGPAEAPAGAKASLSKDDIFSAVKQNAAKAAPCLQAARSKGEIQPGSYTFTLDWTILPNGSVSNATLKGPATVLNSSLPGCFASVIGSWKFPASQVGAPIRNFPFGPITIK